MNRHKLAVIGVGNMAKAIISGIQNSDTDINEILLFDKNSEQYGDIKQGRCKFIYADNIKTAIENADIVLLSVKPQNFGEILTDIRLADKYRQKHYVTIAAGISIDTIKKVLGDVCVTRVMPNLPLTVGTGVSAICRSDNVSDTAFALACSLFSSIGSIIHVQETDMNKIICVTSSSPAYVLKFINAIYIGALNQGLDASPELLNAVCDVFIGTAELLKASQYSAQELIKRVASKGGTTERALLKLEEFCIDEAINEAMLACTKRAEELGNISK